MRRWIVAAAMALPLAAGSACVKAECSQNGVWGIEIAVRDQNGTAQADSALAVLTDISYKDTMVVNGFDIDGRALVLAGARDRAGVYNLCLRKTGFADYIQNNIQVPATACGINQQLFQITLALPSDTATVC